MISPSTLITHILAHKLNNNKSFLGITHAVEGTEDLVQTDLQPAYQIVYADFDQAGKIMEDGSPRHFPCSIYVMCASPPMHETADSFFAALSLAVKTIRLLIDEYTLPNLDGQDEYMRLECKDGVPPLTIMQRDKEVSIIRCNFTYQIPVV